MANMKIFFGIFLSLHVHVLCLTFFKSETTLELTYNVQNEDSPSKTELNELPNPLPLQSPPTQPLDKTFSVSRPTSNPEENKVVLSTTRSSSVSMTQDNSTPESLLTASLQTENNQIDEQMSNSTDIYEEINNNGTENANLTTDNASFGYNDENTTESCNTTQNIDPTGPTFLDKAREIAIQYESWRFHYILNSTIIGNQNSTSNGNKTECLSLRIIRKMFDPRHIDLLYFFGGVASIFSVIGALLLTRKLYRMR